MGRHKDGVNISKSQFIVHSFYFALEAAQVCMVPFLTLFFRRIGLSALEVGAVLSLKALLWCLMAPVGTRLAANCGMKKVVFLLSIFVYTATYLVVTLVPSADKNFLSTYCHVNSSGQPSNKTQRPVGPIDWIPTFPEDMFSTIPSTEVSDNIKAVTDSNVLTMIHNASGAVTASSMGTPTSSSPELITVLHSTTMEISTTERDKGLSILKKLMIFYHLTAKQLSKMSRDDLQTLVNGMSESVDVSDSDSATASDDFKRVKRYLSKDMRRSISHTVEVLRSHVFILVAAVILIGEVVSSPLTYLADNLWFWFLEGIDASEHYGHHKTVSLIAAALFSILVTVIIDNTSCILMFEIDHFMIHFYLFAGCMILTFVLGLCFPSPARNSKVQKKKKLTWKALCLIGKDKLHILCVLSVFIIGGLRASVLNYLFWVVADFGPSEIMFGFLLCISYLSSIPLLIFQKVLVKKLTAMGIIALAFFVFSIQSLYYSFLWTVWAVLPIQVLTGVVETGFWIGIKSISSFHTTSPAVDREVQLVFENIYHGVGFATGAILSGWLADVFGFSILYQCASVASLIWALLFLGAWRLSISQDRSTIRYSKLNLAGDDDGVSDHGFDEDDWLEVALKDDH